MDNLTSTAAASGRRGRPHGSKTLEPSTLVARLKKKMGCTFEDMAPQLKVREKTVRNYVDRSLIPTKGETRDLLEALAKAHSEPVLDEAETVL